MEKMIDIHSHLIPEFDDGPRSFDESLEMLQQAQDQGITDVFATSHFYEIITKDAEQEYFTKLQELRERAEKKNIRINIYSGGELFYHPQLEDTLKKNKVSTLGNWGQYVLFEFPMFLMPDGAEHILFQLTAANFLPIVAHPERYSAVIRQPKRILDFIRFGGFIQMNAGSILGHFGKEIQKVSMSLLRQRLVQFIASDAHVPKGRTFVLSHVYEFLKDKVNEAYLEELLYINPRKIIDQQRLEKANVPEEKHLENFFVRIKNRLKILSSS